MLVKWDEWQARWHGLLLKVTKNISAHIFLNLFETSLWTAQVKIREHHKIRATLVYVHVRSLMYIKSLWTRNSERNSWPIFINDKRLSRVCGFSNTLYYYCRVIIIINALIQIWTIDQKKVISWNACRKLMQLSATFCTLCIGGWSGIICILILNTFLSVSRVPVIRIGNTLSLRSTFCCRQFPDPYTFYFFGFLTSIASSEMDTSISGHIPFRLSCSNMFGMLAKLVGSVIIGTSHMMTMLLFFMTLSETCS